MVLELKDKLKAEQELTNVESSKEEKSKAKEQSYSNDARDALQILGYNRRDVENALAKIDRSLSTEEIIKQALKILS